MVIEGYQKVRFVPVSAVFLRYIPCLCILQYPDGIFRVPLLLDWLVYCSGPQFTEIFGKQVTANSASPHRPMRYSLCRRTRGDGTFLTILSLSDPSDPIHIRSGIA
jgi:hypothetical protein